MPFDTTKECESEKGNIWLVWQGGNCDGYVLIEVLNMTAFVARRRKSLVMMRNCDFIKDLIAHKVQISKEFTSVREELWVQAEISPTLTNTILMGSEE